MNSQSSDQVIYLACWDEKTYPLKFYRVNAADLSRHVGLWRTIIVRFALFRLKMLGITLFPFVIVRGDDPVAGIILESGGSSSLMRHEFVHLLQQWKTGRTRFYFCYLWNWMKEFFKRRNWLEAYLHVQYEVEARDLASKPLHFQKLLKECGVISKKKSSV